MHERFISNPFSSQHPLQGFGTLRKGTEGYQYDGLPYIGPPLPFKDDDPEEMRPQMKHKACCAQLDLSDPTDMESYRAISQKVCDGEAIVSFEEKVYDDAIKSWRVLMRWMEPYFGPPPAAQEIIQDIKNNTDKKTMHIAPETDMRKPRDHAKVVAEKLSQNPDEQQEPGNASRYATIDQALNLLSSDESGFLLDAQPGADGDAEGSSGDTDG